LADFLFQRREQILEKWIHVLQVDPEHNVSKRLDPEEIRDHVDQLLEHLIDALQSGPNPEPMQYIRAVAGEHGRCRLTEGYLPEELILELSHLRSIFIPHFFEFLERNPDLGAAACITLGVNLHRLLDDTMRSSVVEYLRAHQGWF